ncbi:C45 family autoproteolytic acyltransferase/hydolase [Salimicrobium halophilum]|uniref:Predicted choloylglycine hydrolase n=1 Tax=Salimicrobium halophilum TaxID=86666 RepID=A0A1G8U9A7_9BACI|nr:C45 family peptidase [Salimicrobium halophilum]SDJ50348.1 Predicted choloylglycine hydrolase [Salimicrobium halophilum]
MKQIHSDIIQFRGSHYDFGFSQGLEIKNTLTVRNRRKQWDVRIPRFDVEEQEVKEVIEKFAPGIWRELEGLRDALEWPMKRVLMEFGGYRVPYKKSGCSILTGEGYMIRNYDYMPKTYEGRFAFFQPTDAGYATAGPTQRITGRMDGMNEHGLALGYTFMNRKRPGPGFICCMIGRMVLETCRDVEEAVAMLERIPHRHSFSYTVFDSSDVSYVVEASPRGVEVRQTSVCTNHFEILTKENRYHLVDSKRRMDTMKQSLPSSAEEAFRLLNDRDKGVFSELYDQWAGTIHTSGYLPGTGTIWFALGGDRSPVEFDFSAWLKGERVPQSFMEGEVDTAVPFVHIDEGAHWSK